MSKCVTTLIEDIKKLFSQEIAIDETKVGKAIDDLSYEISSAVINALSEQRKGNAIRMSKLGGGARKLWYEHRDADYNLPPEVKMKFMLGNIYESIVLFLASLAGHEVTDRQKLVSLGGIEGHIDAKIDGVLVDVKTASGFSMNKYKSGTLSDDPFGYAVQLNSYRQACDEQEAKFLFVNKEDGQMMFVDCPVEDVKEKILETKRKIEDSAIPERCYAEIPLGASGNMGMGTGCYYCNYRRKCWSDDAGNKLYRSFAYAGGVKHLTLVKKEPEVPEVFE